MRLTQSHLFAQCNLRRQTAGPRICKLIDHYSYLFSCCCCFCCCCCCCCCCSIPQLNTLLVTQYMQMYIDKILFIGWADCVCGRFCCCFVLFFVVAVFLAVLLITKPHGQLHAVFREFVSILKDGYTVMHGACHGGDSPHIYSPHIIQSPYNPVPI